MNSDQSQKPNCKNIHKKKMGKERDKKGSNQENN